LHMQKNISSQSKGLRRGVGYHVRAE
jgi:hypothetical protein